MKFNYHTHTSRCMHAIGLDEEYVLHAIAAGFDEIGFSDHSPWPFIDFESDMRMHVNELDDYINNITKLKNKYKDKISIKIGFECEYYKIFMPWLKRTVKANEIDYLILGHHFNFPESTSPYYGATQDPQEVLNYANEVVQAMQTGLFSYVAHPDLFMRSYPKFDKTCEKASRYIIQASIDYNIPLEYNLLGLRQQVESEVPCYPHIEFWKLVGELGAKAVIGVDVHNPVHFHSDELYFIANKTLKKLNVEVVSSIRMFEYE